jgi:hypothetical protein
LPQVNQEYEFSLIPYKGYRMFIPSIERAWADAWQNCHPRMYQKRDGLEKKTIDSLFFEIFIEVQQLPAQPV